MSFIGNDLSTPLLLLGGGGVVLGLIELLEPSDRRGLSSWSNRLAIMFLLGGAAAGAVGVSLSVWGVIFFLGAAPFALAGLRWLLLRVRSRFSGLLGRWRFDAVLLLCGCPLLAAMGALQIQRAAAVAQPRPANNIRIYPPLVRVAFHACTDRGQTLPLWSLAPTSNPKSAMSSVENQLGKALLLKLCRTAPPDLQTNCHGWVFCAGRFCVHNDDVDLILHDNDYELVSKPRAGDLIIYRNDLGGVLHSGIVRTTTNDMVIVESKWGILGRYLHAPADQLYSTHWDFYHSSREGHLLKIADD